MFRILLLACWFCLQLGLYVEHIHCGVYQTHCAERVVYYIHLLDYLISICLLGNIMQYCCARVCVCKQTGWTDRWSRSKITVCSFHVWILMKYKLIAISLSGNRLYTACGLPDDIREEDHYSVCFHLRYDQVLSHGSFVFVLVLNQMPFEITNFKTEAVINIVKLCLSYKILCLVDFTKLRFRHEQLTLEQNGKSKQEIRTNYNLRSERIPNLRQSTTPAS